LLAYLHIFERHVKFLTPIKAVTQAFKREYKTTRTICTIDFNFEIGLLALDVFSTGLLVTDAGVGLILQLLRLISWPIA
jgi:hypothetical protein